MPKIGGSPEGKRSRLILSPKTSLSAMLASTVVLVVEPFDHQTVPLGLDWVPSLFPGAFMAWGRQFDLHYSVELWDDNDSHIEQLIALTGDYRVARAAFEEAVKRRPGRIVTLRQKTRLLADSRRKN
jgi:hypothetical protein